MKKNVKKVLLFIGLTFGLSWLLAVIFFAFGGKWNTPTAQAMAVVYMFMPLTAAVMVQKLIYGENLKEPLGINFKLNQWFLVAWLLPPLLALSALV